MSRGSETSSSPVACFSVRAVPEPGLLLRLLEEFAKRGLIPSSVHARLLGDAGEPVMAADLHVEGLSAEAAEIIAVKLRQTIGVERVLTALKYHHLAA